VVVMMASTFSYDFALLFLNPREAATIDAFVGHIIPSEEGSPGAREAGVTEYIDRSLSGFMRDLQPVYREGLAELEAFAVGGFGAAYLELDDEAQRVIVGRLDELSGTHPDAFLGQFYRIVREHTVQGFFGDPAYGGNRDLAGWKLVGFPGAQWGYSPEQMRPGVESTSIPILTVKDLYSRIGGAR
jgi:gluconate 2-dehydrogenase gamma chain